MKMLIIIFLLLISLIICFMLVILNSYKHELLRKEKEDEKCNNKSFKS